MAVCGGPNGPPALRIATQYGNWVNHEDTNPTTGAVKDKHFWLVLHDGMLFGSGWHHDVSGADASS
jgi:hypothetical protein